MRLGGTYSARQGFWCSSWDGQVKRSISAWPFAWAIVRNVEAAYVLNISTEAMIPEFT